MVSADKLRNWRSTRDLGTRIAHNRYGARMSNQSPKMPEEVEAVFSGFPPKAKKRLAAIRELIFEVAAQSDEIGELTETLKWGEPAYLTEKTRSGSTLRIGYKDTEPAYVAMYFNCQTTLVEKMRWSFSEAFKFDGNRAVKIDVDGRLPRPEIRECIDMALRYHRLKRSR